MGERVSDRIPRQNIVIVQSVIFRRRGGEGEATSESSGISLSSAVCHTIFRSGLFFKSGGSGSG